MELYGKSPTPKLSIKLFPPKKISDCFVQVQNDFMKRIFSAELVLGLDQAWESWRTLADVSEHMETRRHGEIILLLLFKCY